MLKAMKRLSSPDGLSPPSREALQIFGARVTEQRRARRWSLKELAERVGVSENTLRKVERGNPTVAIGVAFEAAAIVGVELFDGDETGRALERERTRTRLALLPKRVDKPAPVDNGF
jgi:transcriptional regulator with XRE-family HTH domain